VTLGPTTADLWRASVQSWQARCGPEAFGPWLFSPIPGHQSRLRTSTLGHWFARLCDQAGMPQVTLHRLRHSVATALVSRGKILQAQNRLGHADRTPRYASTLTPCRCTSRRSPTSSTSSTAPNAPSRAPAERRPASTCGTKDAVKRLPNALFPASRPRRG
jgi:hypothetical protein